MYKIIDHRFMPTMLILFGSASLGMNVSAQDSFYTLELGLSHDSNIGLAIDEQHIKADRIAHFYADYGLSHELGASRLVTTRVNTEHRRYADYPWLNHTDIGADVTIQQKLGVGLQAPWVSLSTGLAPK